MSDDGQDFLKKALIDALADFGNRDALMAAENLLRHPNAAVRRQQVEFLAKYRKQYNGDVFSVLAAGFDDPVMLVRDATLQLALEMPDEKLISRVVEMLESGAGPDVGDARESRKNVDRRRLAADYILACESQQDLLLEPLLAIIEDEHMYTPCRLEAMRALHYEHRMARVRDVLIKALASRDGGVRSYAVQALPYYQNHNDVAVAITRELVSTDNDEVLLARLGALVKLADKASIETFAKFLKHENPAVQELAVSGLHATQATRYRDTLLQMWQAMPDPMGEENRMRKGAPRESSERPTGGKGSASGGKRPAAPREDAPERRPRAGGPGRGTGAGPRTGGFGRKPAAGSRPGGPSRGPGTRPGGPGRGPRAGGDERGPGTGPRAGGPGRGPSSGPSRGPRSGGTGRGPGGPGRGPGSGRGPGGPGRGPSAGPGRGPSSGPGRGPRPGGPGRGPSSGPGRGPRSGGSRPGGPGRKPGGPRR